MIKFYKTLEKAILNEDSQAWLTRYDGFIQMLPTETFLQITEEKSDIAFGGNIKAELIDTCGNLQLDITNSFYFEEFIDGNGIKQIRYEFGNLGVDYFGELSILKLSHTVSYAVWFSNPFQITDNEVEKTTLFEYKNDSILYQSVRLNCFRTDINTAIENEEYTQLSGRIISLRPIITDIEKYVFWVCNSVTYKGLVKLLNSNIVYINGTRISNKPKPTKGDRVEDTNFFECEFESNPTSEVLDLGYQLYQGLILESKYPLNQTYTAINNAHLQLYFNKNISITTDITAKIYKDGALFYTASGAEITTGTNDLNIDLMANPITDLGTYSIVIEPNKIYNNYDLFTGLTYGEWIFKIGIGDFLSTDFLSTDFLIY